MAERGLNSSKSPFSVNPLEWKFYLVKHVNVLRKTHIKKCSFSGRTTKVLPPPPNGLVVHATFFFFSF